MGWRWVERDRGVRRDRCHATARRLPPLLQRGGVTRADGRRSQDTWPARSRNNYCPEPLRGKLIEYTGARGYSQNSGVVAVHNPSVTLPVSNPPQEKAWHASPLSQSPGSLHTWV